MEDKTIKPKNNTIPHIFAMLFMLVLGAIFIEGTIFAAKNHYINTHANYVKEYATIVRYEAVKERYHQGYTYTIYYEYEADDGVYYGMWRRLIRDEEEAKAQVGKKVPIYVDHSLKHHTTNPNSSAASIWILSGLVFICFLIFLNSFVRETIYLVKKQRNKKLELKNAPE